MAEKESIMQKFAMQNAILNVKAELDQLVEGPRALNVHNTICSHATLFQETFTLNTKEPSAGMCKSTNHDQYSRDSRIWKSGTSRILKNNIIHLEVRETVGDLSIAT